MDVALKDHLQVLPVVLAHYRPSIGHLPSLNATPLCRLTGHPIPLDVMSLLAQQSAMQTSS
jgi:hypothetical protein